MLVNTTIAANVWHGRSRRVPGWRGGGGYWMMTYIKSMPAEDNGRTKRLYSIDRQYPLFDREGGGHLSRIQRNNREKLKRFASVFSETGWRIWLTSWNCSVTQNRRHAYSMPYAVMDTAFKEFVTRPVESELPMITGISNKCEKFHWKNREVGVDEAEINEARHSLRFCCRTLLNLRFLDLIRHSCVSEHPTMLN